MKKLYICTSGSYSDFRYTEIFLNEDDAKKFEEHCKSIHSNDCENGYEECDLIENYNELFERNKKSMVFSFNLKTNEIFKFYDCDYRKERYAYSYGGYYNDIVYVYVELTNNTKEHHEKIARDYYFILKNEIEQSGETIYHVVNKLNGTAS